MELTLKDRKAIINTGELSQQEQPLQERMNPVGALLGSTTGQSTLADRKAINNLPKYSDGLISKINNWGKQDNKYFDTNFGALGSAVSSGAQFVGAMNDAFSYNKSVDDLQMEAGTSQQSIGGIGYTAQNDVNTAAELSRVGSENTANTLKTAGTGAATGAAIGSVIPGLGTVAGGLIGGAVGFIGGLFGGGKRKREAEKRARIANQTAFLTNEFYRSGAKSTSLQQQFATNYGDSRQQTLYGAADGKPSYSAGGPTEGYNARVSNGEIIANKFTGEIFRVPGLPNNKDGKLALIRPTDTIITNKYGLSDYVAETGDLEGGEAMMSSIMKAKGKQGYKCGKLPKFEDGFWSNIIGHGLPMISEIAQYNNIKNQEVKKPDTYVQNPYESTALYTLGQQQENPYAILPSLYDQYAKGMYAISNSGGLGGGQKTLARLTAMNNLMNHSAAMQEAVQKANIGHRQTYANALLNAGIQEAQNRAAAMRYDLDYYSKAHAAKLAGEQEARKGMWGQFQAGIKGIVDNKRYNEAMDLYRQKTKSEIDYTNFLINSIKNNSTNDDNNSVQENTDNIPYYIKRPDEVISTLPNLGKRIIDNKKESQKSLNDWTDNTIAKMFKPKKTWKDASKIINNHRGVRLRSKDTDMDFWKNRDNIAKLMQVYWDMTGVNKAY